LPYFGHVTKYVTHGFTRGRRPSFLNFYELRGISADLGHITANPRLGKAPFAGSSSVSWQRPKQPRHLATARPRGPGCKAQRPRRRRQGPAMSSSHRMQGPWREVVAPPCALEVWGGEGHSEQCGRKRIHALVQTHVARSHPGSCPWPSEAAASAIAPT